MEYRPKQFELFYSGLAGTLSVRHVKDALFLSKESEDLYFDVIEIAAVEQLESDLQITRHKIETLLTINMRQDAEVTGLKSQIKHWEDKEVEKASCCFENEQENISLKSKLKIVVEAIEKYTDLHHAPKLEETLLKIGGEI
mgnify:CR=1 FL=1